MTTTPPLRALWLLNHTTLRAFELQQLHHLGITEIFVPKAFPYDEGNMSATITYEHDAHLTLPAADLECLNAQNWYEEPTRAAWDIANAHFDVAFIGFFPRQMQSVCRHFTGAIVLRAFGLGGEDTYSRLIRRFGGVRLQSALQRVGTRFWFGMGYDHLAEQEDAFLADRAVFLPVGLAHIRVSDQWRGHDSTILFVCPRIGSSPYFNRIYREFLEHFGDLPHRIGGAQPVAVDDPNVLGFLSDERYADVMQHSRVMFYHSREPNHVHYHPFEAIRAGMPLVFMSGGLLDRMGGIGLPGRCETLDQARRTLTRILDNDARLIARILETQATLLESMHPVRCGQAWRQGFTRIASALQSTRAELVDRRQPPRRTRVAVILPIAYRGGSLRGSIELAKALYLGSRQCGDDADIVFAHLDDPESYSPDTLADLPKTISRRTLRWQHLSPAEARRAMRFAGFHDWEPEAPAYIVPDDGIRQMLDCDVWVIISDRLSQPVLPLRPVVLMVYDYLQRYEDFLPHGADLPFLAAARAAERILVTTGFAGRDAVQYAGIEPQRLSKLPVLAPEFPIRRDPPPPDTAPYFIWPTNAAVHKNHHHAAEAMRIYYEELAGNWECCITGVDTRHLLRSGLPHIAAVKAVFDSSPLLRRRVTWKGELPDPGYRRLLSGARFVWHAGRNDNGNLSVLEAACLGVPGLSSDYPAMREFDQQFSLNLAWMNPHSPRDMAGQLKQMERTAESRRLGLPSAARIEQERVEHHAAAYWREVQECL